MKLIVGLGNPGKKYENTRHNIGFCVVDTLNAKPYTLDAILFKPQSFMNLSGQEVLKKANFYRLKPKDIIVIYDDIDLPFGEIRIRNSGSSGGHKGVQSIIDALKSENFGRVRVGIGRPPENVPAEKPARNASHSDAGGYVLENFNQEEEKELLGIIDEAAEKVLNLL